MNVYEMIESKPHLHVSRDGTPRFMSLGRSTLIWMADQLRTISAPNTLETGYGLTTVLMTMLAKQHHAIAPDPAGYERVLAYCKQHTISAEPLRFSVGFSEDVLPTLALPEESLDMVLVDGGHGIPTPFVDYAYTFKQVKIGGHLLIDDIQLVTGMLLKDYLCDSPEWQLHTLLNGKTAVFNKISRTQATDWYRQPYMVKFNEHVAALLSSESGSRSCDMCLAPVMKQSVELSSIEKISDLFSVTLRVLVTERLASLHSRSPRGLAIYGAGKHTQWLETVCRDLHLNVTAVMDKDPDGKGPFFGLVPIRPTAPIGESTDAIVLSSECQQQDMARDCQKIFGHKVPLIDLYADLPPGPYQK